MASRASVVPGQRIMPFAVKVPDRGSVAQAEDGPFKICEHLGCLRVERPDTLPPCPRSHGAAKEVSSADAVVGHLAELHFLVYLKRAKKEQLLQRVEHLDQRHALRGCDPTMRKRPDFTVWNKSGDEYCVDVKARRTVRDEFFIINRAQAQVMTCWHNPIVVIYERTGEIEIDASRFYVVDQLLLSKRTSAGKARVVLVKAKLPQNAIVF